MNWGSWLLWGFVATVVLTALMRQLAPPGFLALNYGYQTPLIVLAAHLAFGAILGAFYAPPLQ